MTVRGCNRRKQGDLIVNAIRTSRKYRNALFFTVFLVAATAAQPVWAKSTDSAVAQLVDHKTAYNPKPQRGPHLDVKVTPPELRGKAGRVMIEVYNRGKDHIALVTFDVVLKNNSGWSLTAPIKAEDLKPNMSGGQWVEIPKMGEKFPAITGASLSHLRVINVEAQEIKLAPYMDLIKK